MSRRPANLIKIMERDKDTLAMLARVGHCTKIQIQESWLTENRFKSYEAAKLIEEGVPITDNPSSLLR